jgi:signal peptidase I
MSSADPKSTPKSAAAGSTDQAGSQAPPKRRKVSHVKAAAGLLVKEGRRILKKYAARLAAGPADAIRESVDKLEREREANAWERVEDECERLDELLHQHASFARKSAARETIENVGIAVLVALALRSCLYEPFKIPSGSMMPTLRSGDHIFVNKFAYGIQVPFTTTVVGEFMGAPRRGDVIVFRYPVDESEDFIKRVIGLPGDTVRVEGNKVSIKRETDADFEELARTKLSEKCLDEAGENPVPHCSLYEETIDERTYVVRYMSGADPRMGGQRRFGEWKVPAGHYLVMGDNRNQSHDSLAWTRQVEAVTADGLLGVKDLRDLTPEKLFTLSRPDATNTREDSSYDHVVYLADHASDAHELGLEVWRDPVLGTSAVFETLAVQVNAQANATPGGTVKRGSFADLWADMRADLQSEKKQEKDHNKARVARLEAVGQGIGEVVWTRGEAVREAAVMLPSARAVLLVRCGVAVCRVDGMLAERIAEAVERFDRDRSADARALLEGDRTIRYTPHWTSRGPRADKFVERSFQHGKGEPNAANLVRLRAWRAPDEPEEFLRDAALRAVGSSREQARQVIDDSFDDAWLAPTPTSSASCASIRPPRSCSSSSAASSAAPVKPTRSRSPAPSRPGCRPPARTAAACPSCSRPAIYPAGRSSRRPRRRPSATSTIACASTARSATPTTASTSRSGCVPPRASRPSAPRSRPRSSAARPTRAWPRAPSRAHRRSGRAPSSCSPRQPPRASSVCAAAAACAPVPPKPAPWPPARTRRPRTPATSSTPTPNARDPTCPAATSRAAPNASGSRRTASGCRSAELLRRGASP